MYNPGSHELGSNPFQTALDAIFPDLLKMYSAAGWMPNHLIGFEFNDGKVVKVTVTHAKTDDAVERLHLNLTEMLKEWPIVAHVMDAWETPASDTVGSRAERHEIVAVVIHSFDAAMYASCPADSNEKTIEKGELRRLDNLTNRFGVASETRH